MSINKSHKYWYLSRRRTKEVRYYLPNLSLRTAVFIRDSLLVSYHDGAVHLSRDGGLTFVKSMPIGDDIGSIKYIHLFTDETLLVCNHTKAFYSKDFISYSQSAVIGKNGEPMDLTFPNNFSAYNHDRKVQILDGVEMLVWGNYTLNGGPILVWYTTDKGATIKLAYQFNIPGSNSATHVHNVIFNPADKSFWIQTGDYFPPEVSPLSHFMKCLYDMQTDTWTFETIGSSLPFKSTNLLFFEDYVYWTWDTTNGGVIRCRYDEIADVTKHEQILVTPNDCLDLIMSDRGELIATQSFFGGLDDTRNIWYSPDRVNFHKILTTPDVPWNSSTCYYGIRGPNSDGRVMAGVMNYEVHDTLSWEMIPSVYLDEFIRDAGFPNAFKPL